MKRLDEAIVKYQESLKLKRLKLPENSISIANTLNNVSAILIEKNQYADAFIKCKESLAIYRKSLASNHILIEDTVNNLVD